jgi:hypothetical protein
MVGGARSRRPRARQFAQWFGFGVMPGCAFEVDLPNACFNVEFAKSLIKEEIANRVVCVALSRVVARNY